MTDEARVQRMRKAIPRLQRNDRGMSRRFAIFTLDCRIIYKHSPKGTIFYCFAKDSRAFGRQYKSDEFISNKFRGSTVRLRYHYFMPEDRMILVVGENFDARYYTYKEWARFLPMRDVDLDKEMLNQVALARARKMMLPTNKEKP